MPSQAKKLDKNARSSNENVYTINQNEWNKHKLINSNSCELARNGASEAPCQLNSQYQKVFHLGTRKIRDPARNNAKINFRRIPGVKKGYLVPQDTPFNQISGDSVLLLWPTQNSVCRETAKEHLAPIEGVFDAIDTYHRLNDIPCGQSGVIRLTAHDNNVFFMRAIEEDSCDSHKVVDAFLIIKEFMKKNQRKTLSILAPFFENKACFHFLDQICEKIFEAGSEFKLSINHLEQTEMDLKGCGPATHICEREVFRLTKEGGKEGCTVMSGLLEKPIHQRGNVHLHLMNVMISGEDKGKSGRVHLLDRVGKGSHSSLECLLGIFPDHLGSKKSSELLLSHTTKILTKILNQVKKKHIKNKKEWWEVTGKILRKKPLEWGIPRKIIARLEYQLGWKQTVQFISQALNLTAISYTRGRFQVLENSDRRHKATILFQRNIKGKYSRTELTDHEQRELKNTLGGPQWSIGGGPKKGCPKKTDE